jgi:hypothetical protein
MNQLIKLLFILIVFPNAIIAQKSKKNYEYNIDLLHISNDEVKVSFAPPKNNLKQGNLLFPNWFPDFIRL